MEFVMKKSKKITKSSRPPNLQDIADITGCSKNTVSLILRGATKFSKNLTKEVKKKAKSVGYVRNYAAWNLSTRRSGIIGVYSRSLQDAVRSELVNHLLQNLNTVDYKPLLGVGQGQEKPWYESSWIQTFHEFNIDALVLVVEDIKKLPNWARKIPTVILGCQPRPSLKCDYVGLDRLEAVSIAIKYLASQKIKKLVIAAREGLAWGKACIQISKKYGFDITTIELPVKVTNLDFVRTQNKLRKLGKIDRKAILFGDSPIAARFAHDCLQNAPEILQGLKIVSYDYLPWADMLKVPLTTIEQPISELAKTAVDVITLRLAKPSLPPIHKVLKHQLFVR